MKAIDFSFWTFAAGMLTIFLSLCLADLRVMLAGLLVLLVSVITLLNKL